MILRVKLTVLLRFTLLTSHSFFWREEIGKGTFEIEKKKEEEAVVEEGSTFTAKGEGGDSSQNFFVAEDQFLTVFIL